VNVIFGFACCVSLNGLPADVDIDRPVPQFAIGKEFVSKLQQEFTGSWKNVTLRTILNRISSNTQISILLDRRIDPTSVPIVDFKQGTLLDALRKIAAQSSAGLSVVGNTVFIGPKPSVSKLRTLVELRSDEMNRQPSKSGRGRKSRGAKTKTIHWNDLDTPSQLLEQITETYGLKSVDGNRLPHDLWAGSTLPHLSVSEALSLVLIQFDLTFEWNRNRDRIQWAPIPDAVFIERVYELRRAKPSAAAEKWRAEVPGIVARVKSGNVVVRGTVEQHEQLQEFLNPHEQKSKIAKAAPVSLRKRRFKLRLRFTPAAKLFANLEKNGVIIRYDERALEKAGIDLNQKISLDVDNATANEFFKEVCDPLGLTFTIKGATVKLSPK